jgi:hypothetical protein
MSNPSFLNVPYRFKAGTLYSQIPDSGLGDFVVSRSASNAATRVNAQGFIETVADNVPRLDYPLGGIANGCPALLVEPSAENLAKQSEAFNTTWLALAGATVTPNTIAAPDNNVTADTINLTTASESRVQQGSITIANSTTYTMSCFYKNIALTAGQTFRMRFNNTNSAPNDFIVTAVIDLAAGTATYSIGGTSGTGFSGTATGRVDNYGNGWYRVSMTFRAGTAGATATGIFDAGNNNSGAARSFYAWGAQFEIGSVPTSYIPTTTAPITRGADLVSKTGVSSLIGQTEGTMYLDFIFRRPRVDVAGLCGISSSNAQNRLIFWNNSSFNTIAVSFAANNLSVFNISVGTLTEGTRYKLAIGYKTGNSAIFLNGVQVGSTRTDAFTFSTSLVNIFLGTYETGTSTITNTGINAFALFPTRLTNAQLQALTT